MLSDTVTITPEGAVLFVLFMALMFAAIVLFWKVKRDD